MFYSPKSQISYMEKLYLDKSFWIYDIIVVEELFTLLDRAVRPLMSSIVRKLKLKTEDE